ncbi:3-isopropylmalate dehydratase large subunit [candidate division KSB1 bacterium]|nr:3-isopropylmalate dehydratase large subunit [candidate division KSB1 bacterium]
MTITEKILAAHSGRQSVRPGELIMTRLDLVLGNDITAPLAIEEFYRSGAKQVWDSQRVVLIPDHFTPNKDIKSAEQCKLMRQFAREQGLTHYYEVGRTGIEHAFLPEQGIVLPGDCMLGADSHTCTYGALGAFATGVGSTDLAAAMITGETWFKVPASIQLNYFGELQPWVSGKDLILYAIKNLGVDGANYKALEFTGETISNISVEGRLTMANMAIEAGAKNGIFTPDAQTLRYVNARARRNYQLFESDADAEYVDRREFDVRKIEPQVAFPHLPENARPVSEATQVAIDQVIIGSCTNGRIEDLRIAAKILQRRKVNLNVRCIIIPATPTVYADALHEGLIEIFLQAEAVVSTPTCGPCLGGHMGILAAGERAVATTNRNFIGRMGHPQSEVYLASPAIAAASAVLGRIGSPTELGLLE